MSELPWTEPSGCPSELELDRLHLGELDAGERARVEAHARGCERCQARLASRQQGLAAWPALHPEQSVERLHQRIAGLELPVGTLRRARELAGNAPPARTRPPRWALRALLGSAAAAAVGLALALNLPTSDPNDVRTKGTPGLEVFRERQGEVTAVAANERLRAGDRLRFKAVPPKGEGELAILGEEAGGRLFPYVPVRAPNGGLLEGAMALDASKGQEWIHLAWCPRHFELGEIQPGAERGRLQLPADCRAFSLPIVKE